MHPGIRIFSPLKTNVLFKFTFFQLLVIRSYLVIPGGLVCKYNTDSWINAVMTDEMGKQADRKCSAIVV